MNPASRQKVLLGILGLLLLIMAWRYLRPALGGGEDAGPAVSAPFDPESAGEPVGLPQLPRARRSTQPQDDPERVAELHLPDLQRVPPSYTPGRDPWRFVDPPPPPLPPPLPPPPPPSAEELEARRRAAEEAARLARERAAELAKPRPPEFTLQYLGNIGARNRRIAVFSDGKREYIVQEGEKIQNQFIVARIGYESVEIKFVNFPDEPAKRVALQRRR